MNYLIYPGIMHKFQENYKGVVLIDDDIKIKNIILSIVSTTTDVSITEILGNLRLQKIRESRQISHYFLKKFTSFSLKEIGRITNNDHSSVIHSVKTIKNGVEYNQQLNRKVKRIETEILTVIKKEL